MTQLESGTMVTHDVRLVELLDEGGMASIWVADHLTTGTRVAVKVLPPDLLLEEPTLAARFHREAEVTQQIDCPHVVQTMAHGMLNHRTPYIVMELLEGCSLASRLELEGPLGVRDTVTLVTQVAEALAAAHGLGIIHRDITADNVFLVEGGGDLFVKVLDFGIAKRESTDDDTFVTATGVAVGTVEYMSPAQVEAEDVDAEADRWALAVVAYRALTGELPFTGPTHLATCMAITEGVFRPPSELTAGLAGPVDAWFARCFAVDPADRFPSVRAMASALVEATAATIRSDQPPTPPAALRPAEPLKPTVDGTVVRPTARRAIAIGVVVAAVLAAVVGWYGLVGPQP